MSSSGQGDQIPDKIKDEEGEITSTTSDNGATKPNEMTATDREAVSIAPDSTESSEGNEASVDMATTSDKPQEGVDTTMHEADISKVLHTDTNLSEEVTSIVTKPSEESNTDLTKDPETEQLASSKDIDDLIQDDAEKDSSSVSEELELRWEEDDDDENVEAAPTDDVLKMLDRELGMDDVSNKFDTGGKDKNEKIVKGSVDETNAAQNVSSGSIKMLETSDVTDIQDVKSIPTVEDTNVEFESLLIDQTTDKNVKDKQDEVDDGKASNSFEESQKIITEIDSLTQDAEQDIEIKKGVESSDPDNIENAETIDDLSKEISEDIVMEEMVSNDVTEKHECCVPLIDKIDEVPSESSNKHDVEEMDVDSSESIHKKPFVEDKQLVATDIATINDQPDKIIEAKSIEDTLAKDEQTEKVTEEVQNITQTVEKLVIPEDSNRIEIEDCETNITEGNVSKNHVVEMDVCDIPSMKVQTDNVKEFNKAEYSQTDVKLSEALTKEQLITKDADVMQIDVPQEIDEHEIPSTKIDEHVIAETKDDDLKIDKTKVDVQEIVKTKVDEQKIDRTKVDEDIVNTSLEDSLLDITITPNIHHRINKPNVMLDIPTQELSDIEAELDSDSELNDSTENMQKTNIIVKDSAKIETLKTLSDIKKSEEKSIEVNATSTKTNISTVSPLKSDQTTSKSVQDAVSSLKSLKFNDKPSQTKDNVDTSTSKIQDIEKPSTSEKQEKIETPPTKLPDNVEKTSTSKIAEANDVEMASTSQTPDNVGIPSTSEIQDNVDKTLTSNTETNEVEIASTSKTQDKVEATSTSKTQENVEALLTSIKQDVDVPTSTQDDEKPSTSKVNDEPSTSIKQEANIKQEAKIKQETGDEIPSTSEKLTPDDDDDIQEVTDSLGLLAESSRVMDDNDDDEDDAEDAEADENDDDEDFDPYEESSNQMLDDLEDSNTPPPDLDAKNLDMPPKVQESDEGTMDLADGTMDIVDDIECVENELPDMDIGDVSETPNEETEKEGEPVSIGTVQHDVKKAETKPPQKIISILEKVLGQTVKDKKKSTSDAAGKVLNYVEVEGSSDSDDVLEVSKSDSDDVMSVNIPAGVEVMSTSGPRSSSEILSKKGEVVISGVPKPPPLKVSKLNTSEVSIKTAGKPSPSIHIPEAGINKKAAKDEIFNLDSDEDETEMKDPYKTEETAKEESPKTTDRKCINPQCVSGSGTYYQADRATVAYFSLTRRSGVVCEECKLRASERAEALISGVRDLRPLLELEMDAPANQLVEISDSDEDEDATDDTDFIGEDAAKFLEEHLADMLNETWVKYNLESRLKETEICLMKEMAAIEADAKEIDAMLDECQKKTDAIRTDFYKDYEVKRKSVGGIIIHDTPFSSYSHTERDVEDVAPQAASNRYPKRRATSIAQETPAKKQAIPLGYSSLDGKQEPHQGISDQNKAEDDKEDISVVKLSAESAPPDLPPCGEITRPPLKAGMVIYAMRNAFGTWLKGKIMDVQPKIPGNPFTQCKVKFEHKVKNPCKVLAARCLAYTEPPEVRMTIGTRVIALFKDPQNTARRESFYSGVVAEIPNPVNNYRYLVFFDDGYAQYVHHQDTRIVCESSNLVWEEVHPFIRDFICNYLLSYPERPMVRLHKGERLKTEWNGKWWESKVLQVDASIALIHFDEDNRTEWIYRGSTRLAPLYLELQAAEKAGEGKTRSRLPRSKAQMRSNMPCVEYTRSDEQPASKPTDSQAQQQHNEELRRQRSVAKKSTAPSMPAPVAPTGTPVEGVISRVVYYTPKNAVKPYKMSTHTCSVKCKRTDLLSLKDLRTYNPLAKPLLSGWERQTVRYKGHREVMYRAPCGRRLRNMAELHKYLRILQSDMSVDLFDFTPGTHCLAEFVLNKCIVGKKDLSHGKENVPVPCVNYYDDSLPEFCSYNTERTPTAGVPLNLDPEFLCGCDCTDDCVDKTKCACWKMTLEGAKTIGMDDPNIGYVYRRLPEPLPSGIYECNSRCKCKQTCLNRVAQHPLQLKLQVFKTINRGWGIRALNDVPKGSFLCVYAGNLLTDATANLDGLNEGDEYLAELDYIEVVEGMKEGYEDDIPEADKKLDKAGRSDTESSPSSESEEEREKSEKDDDFQPGYIAHSNMMFKKSLRKREKAKKKETEQASQKEATKKTDDCITISDDEEVREPSRFTAQAGMDGRDLISKHSSRVSVRTLFGKDEACYIMDAKVQGNIGRYLNHSCHPNVFVQNVFVDTHDPRFPWVAFFALSHVRAGTELTWNYNYDIGSVPGKCLYCYCGAPNCRGRLL